jgi:Fe-S oxidoreductase/nitrate reductase gamma subunit
MYVPTRIIYWNVVGHLVLYAFVAAGAAAFLYGVYRRWRNWSLGRPETRWDKPWTRAKGFFGDTVLHLSVLKEAYPGIMHFCIFYGFVVLALGTAVVLLQADLGLNVLYGPFYLWLSLALDVLGLLGVIGLLLAAFRRYILRPKRLDSAPDDALTLTALLVILLTGYVIEGLRMAAAGDQWALWSPVGLLVARGFGATLGAGGVLAPAALGVATLETWHRTLWWLHMILAVGFVAYMPYSKLFHVFLAPANQFLRRLGPKGALTHIDIENSETFGVSRLDEFSWKQLFDTDACTRCGRCQDQCPANAAGKTLTPKGMVQNMRRALEKYGPTLAKAKATVRAGLLEQAAKDPKAKRDKRGRLIIDPAKEYEAMEEAVAALEVPALIDDVITEDVLWNCTTCRSCEDQCPIFVEIISKVIEMRRYLVLMESRMPTEVGRTLRSLQNNGNPWGLARTGRSDWIAKAEAKRLEPGREVDYLLWVGCFGAFDDRSRAITEATVRILKAAGVDFGVIGEGETCCGDSARRLGNEYLYQTLAQENIESLKAYKFKKIVTACPHCLNALKNEYPQLGGADGSPAPRYEVVHHSQLIAELVATGKLKLGTKLEGEAAKVTFHDPCYLGRYQGEFAAPRRVIKAAGGRLVEMARHGRQSFCCGAGGGRMWLEEEAAHKVNSRRAEQALKTKVGTVVTACPYCLQMFDDGLKACGEQRDITKDIAEIVAGTL